MNPKLDFIFARRSIRAFDPEPIDDTTVRDLLEAGMAAPSAAGADPWRFIVVRDRATLRRLSAGLPHGKMLGEAGLGIVICGEVAAAHDGQLSFMLQATAACTENILLAATALGLGSVWLGIHPREDRDRHLRRVLGIPAEITPVAAIAIGRPAEHKPPRTRHCEAFVHSERW
jgi:nitroreductase